MASRPPNACVSCGAEVTDQYCPRCGERRLGPDDFSLRHFLRRSLGEALSLDGKAYRSFELLALRPGRLTMEFMRGRRRPYLRPIQIFLLANLFYFVVQPYGGFDGYNSSLRSQLTRQSYSDALALDRRVADRVEEEGTSYEAFEAAFNDRSRILARTLVGAMIPLLALLLALLFARQRKPFVTHLVLATHYYAWELIVIMTLTGLILAWGPGLISAAVGSLATLPGMGWLESAWTYSGGIPAELVELVPLPLVGAYVFLALRRVYGEAATMTAAKTAVVLVGWMGIAQAYRLMLFWVTLITV